MNEQRTAIHFVHDQATSGMATAVSRGLRLIGWKRAFLRKLDSGGYPDAPAVFPFWMRMQYRVSVVQQEGRRMWTLAPRGSASGKVVLYLHGGAYVRNINFFH